MWLRICGIFVFVLFTQKTAYELRISDWSSDVCSSDLRAVEQKLGHLYERVHQLEDAEDAPRKEYVSTAARGDAQGGLIGGLVYVGALAAAGAVFASGDRKSTRLNSSH